MNIVIVHPVVPYGLARTSTLPPTRHPFVLCYGRLGLNSPENCMDNKALYLDEPLVVGRSENDIVSIVLEHHSSYDFSLGLGKCAPRQ